MADRGKIFRALDCLSWNAQDGTCNGCAYFRPFTDDPDTGWCDRTTAMADALALLKKQEPVPNGKRIKAGDVVLGFYECGYCKNAIRKPWRYCPFCGHAVKWDATD